MCKFNALKGQLQTNMQLQERINAFVELGKFLNQFSSETASKQQNLQHNDRFYDSMRQLIATAHHHNGWFTTDNIQFACKSWAEALSEANLKQWTSAYTINTTTPKTIAIVMAGNVPLVGFHDFLSVLISGNKVLAKLSKNDKLLLPFIAKYIIAIEPRFEAYIAFSEGKLENFDAVIATGSDNTSRYFDYYFGKYPNIIRKNRNSIAVLTGNETPAQLEALAHDVFRYFGLGCRNVSKIYFPEGYDMDPFFNGMYSWKQMVDNNKYINNYDYNKAVYLMSLFNILDNEFLLLKEDEGMSSPISVLFYEYYTDLDSLKVTLTSEAEKIQCIVGQTGIENEIDFGMAQSPQLWDYADGVDTLKFILEL